MNGDPTVEVDTSIELRLLVGEQPSLPLPVSLRYGASDPYAVTVRFYGPDEHVEWVFARELLALGLTGEQGLGDVKVRAVNERGTDVVIISLASPDGRADLEADAADLRAFLSSTERIVPMGAEHRFYDIDAEVESLLAG